MKNTLRNCVWYTVTLALMVFNLTIFVILGDKATYIKAALAVSFLPQLFGLVYYLHSKKDADPPRLLKIILFLCRLSVIGVVGCLLLAVYSLSNQYHNYVPASGVGEAVTVEQTDDFYILYPNYTSLELETGDRPSRRDKSVIFCCGAAFQLDYSLRFSHEKICGDHVSHGQLYSGYEEARTGAFAYYNNTYHFAAPEDAEELILTAAKEGGCAFRQFPVIVNGEIRSVSISKCRCFRVLAEYNGKLCVIDAKRPCYYSDFAAALQEMGVTEALYADMGSGWNYSWYRNGAGKAKTLIGLPWPFSHNWLVFKG